MQKSVFLLLISLVITATAWAAETVPPTAPPDSSNWEKLFSDDLANAVFPKGIWSVKDGELSATQDQAIWSAKQYENYILDLEFKTTPGSNSGVVIHCSDMGNWIPHSIEIQLADSFGQQPSNGNCAAIYGHVAPKKQLVKKPGEWNRMIVTCKGTMIYVMLNGEQVAQMDMTKWTSAKKNPDGSDIPAWLSTPLAQIAPKGHIGFQGAHGGHAKTFFRNIKIKTID